jgi:hypothetical protein
VQSGPLTAKMTAKPVDDYGRRRTITNCRSQESNLGGRWWTVVDISPTVFKTVCGALLRRPEWVRFPSIPANFGGHDDRTPKTDPPSVRVPRF